MSVVSLTSEEAQASKRVDKNPSNPEKIILKKIESQLVVAVKFVPFQVFQILFGIKLGKILWQFKCLHCNTIKIDVNSITDYNVVKLPNPI